MKHFPLRLALGLSLAFGVSTAALAQAADNSHRLPPKKEEYSFEGPFGTYDRGALQRGFQVY